MGYWVWDDFLEAIPKWAHNVPGRSMVSSLCCNSTSFRFRPVVWRLINSDIVVVMYWSKLGLLCDPPCLGSVALPGNNAHVICWGVASWDCHVPAQGTRSKLTTGPGEGLTSLAAGLDLSWVPMDEIKCYEMDVLIPIPLLIMLCCVLSCRGSRMCSARACPSTQLGDDTML